MISWPNGYGVRFRGPNLCVIAQVRPAAEEVVIPRAVRGIVTSSRKWANLFILFWVVRSFLKII